MERLRQYFRIHFREKDMIAEVDCREPFLELEEKLEVDIDIWKSFLTLSNVRFGIQYQAIAQLAGDPKDIEYPIVVAKGLSPVNGIDGKIEYLVDIEQEMQISENWNFREVMKIPSVMKGQKLAKISEPTSGIDGKNVMGEVVKAPPGKSVVLRPGKNVVFNALDNCYYATEDGQFSIKGKHIQVLPEFHVNETVSMKTGNIDFIGTVIIHGDVPTGYTVKAAGDIKIFGMVEAATIIAGGSIYIAEGIAGQDKGVLQAGDNLKIGYINQAKVSVGKDLYVENSILHSECVVCGHVYSQKGNIIGGILSAGKTIEARDIGSRLNTKTEIHLGINKIMADTIESLNKKHRELEEKQLKLKLLGDKLAVKDPMNPRVRISKLRQKHSMKLVAEELDRVKERLSELDADIGDENKSSLTVRNNIYENVIVAFGKYKRIMHSNYHYVQLSLYQKEIELQQLF